MGCGRPLQHLPAALSTLCRRVTRREVIAVANTATLETAVRGCMEDGATKVGERRRAL